MHQLSRDDIFGFLRPAVDAHTLGISSISQLLEDCGLHTVIADSNICEAANYPTRPESIKTIIGWIRQKKITRLGFSYRLDPHDGPRLFGVLLYQLSEHNVFSDRGGTLRSIYFAGLPPACHLIESEYKAKIPVFLGDETTSESLDKIGVPSVFRPNVMEEHTAYDNMLFAFGSELVEREKHLHVRRIDRAGYAGFGSKTDTLPTRLQHARNMYALPLYRAHVGPYLPDRREAIRLFLDWCSQLAQEGLLDILSVGTSQLSQSHFGQEWDDMPNGGGVPINTPLEFRAVWEAARPMLVRTYAGTTNLPELAHIYEKQLNNAWHTFSLWWFCKTDGRGPLDLMANLEMHLETLRLVSIFGKPYEPNVSHHFAFRGSDDVTYLVTSFLAAKLAKRVGIRHLILQNMLNTPKATWGIQDLAKSRALLTLVRGLEDESFQVLFQPRAGLDFFSHREERAKAQLASVTALMDDIDPYNYQSPEIIHVVSYSEGTHLSNPQIVNESIRITHAALESYRKLRKAGKVPDMAANNEVRNRTEQLLHEAYVVIGTLEKWNKDLYSPRGLYEVFSGGFFPLPYLWGCRDDFGLATKWKTRMAHGGIHVVDKENKIIPVEKRMQMVFEDSVGHG